MKTAYHILVHLLGVGCIAACIAIVATMGSLDIHWSGWLAIGFFALLALGIVLGWFPWRGKPLRVVLKGFYTMSAIALIGFGFKMDDPWRPELWMVLAALAAAVVVRIGLKVVFHLRDDEEGDAPHVQDQKTASSSDPFFN
jgi:peptidoglycan/LPS O-acetylase OafA/YrhL